MTRWPKRMRVGVLTVLIVALCLFLCGCGPDDRQLLEQALASIAADQDLTVEAWYAGRGMRALTPAEAEELVARLGAATLIAGRERSWDPPTGEWGAILSTAGGGRVQLNCWDETGVEMGWYSLRLPTGEVSNSPRSLVLEAPQVASWLKEGAWPAALPADVTAGQVVAGAVRWIEASDCMAIKVDPRQRVNAWLYRQGGEAAVGYGGSLVISGDRLFVALNGQSGLLAAPPDGAVPEIQGPAAPRYVEISAADFPDKESVQGAERVILVWWGLLSEPYHALRAMRPEAGVERGADGSTFTVRGIVRSDDLCRPYLGAATDWAMELGYMVRIEIPVTVTVDAWGRPLETNVAYFGDLVTAQRFGWVRGVWEVEPSQGMGVSEYLDSLKGE